MSASPLRSLKNKNFRYYYFGFSLSQTGGWMQSVALSWLVYKLTGSALLLGLIGFIEQAPAFFLSPVAGVVCDRINLRKLIIFSQIGLALHATALTILVLSGHATTPVLFGLAGLVGLLAVFDTPARSTYVASLVSTRDIPSAIALNAISHNAARVMGPAIAGLVIAVSGEAVCFAFNAISFVPLIVCLFLLKDGVRHSAAVPLMRTHKRSIRVRAEIKRFNTDFLESVDYIKRTPRIKRTLALAFIGCFFGYTQVVLMPVFATNVFGGGPRMLGALLSMIGLGAVCGSFILASRESSQSMIKLSLASSMGMAVSLLIFANTSTLNIAVPALIASGFFLVNFMGSASSIIQCEAEPRLRGRVVSFYTMAHAGLVPAGAVIAGKASEFLSVGTTVSISSALLFCYGFWAARKEAPQQKAEVPLAPPLEVVQRQEPPSLETVQRQEPPSTAALRVDVA